MTKKSYDIGYGRPPAEFKFEKGRSGNPSGRPKGSRSLSGVINAALAERVVVNMEGRRRSISKMEAAFIQLANRAAAGDRHATKAIMELLIGAESRDAARSPDSQISAEDRRKTEELVLDQLAKAMRSAVVEAEGDASV